ncbi:hypothetical protein MC885_018146 [Smutsia gigantea]|nr:hypothetical protein MC885_018146 [Smutsia gigantea]
MGQAPPISTHSPQPSSPMGSLVDTLLWVPGSCTPGGQHGSRQFPGLGMQTMAIEEIKIEGQRSSALGLVGTQAKTQISPEPINFTENTESIVYARVLALHQEVRGLYNYLPWQYEASEAGLLFSAEVEMLCDQAWGSMLEVPAGSRLNLTGLGYFSCHSHTVVQDNSYFFFLRMDENYNLLPHGVNFQDAIFPDTQENRRMFSSLFQFSNCSQGQQLATFLSDWEIQEDNRSSGIWTAMLLMCTYILTNLESAAKLSLSGLLLVGEKAEIHIPT